jgi:uncharacterized membrane protein YhfC
VSFRWLALGGGVWVAGVVLKFLFAAAFNDPILASLDAVLGRTGYISAGSIYIGLLTGVFEIGITLVFAFLIKEMYQSYQKGISIGIGAGVLEALLIGLSQIGYFVMISSGQVQADPSLVTVAATTPVWWLTGPVERLIVILCHTSSRALTLLAVAKKRYIYFWTGFLMMTVIDAIAGYAHLAGLLGKISVWWIELTLLPFAIISIPLILWCIDHWPHRSDTVQSATRGDTTE